MKHADRSIVLVVVLALALGGVAYFILASPHARAGSVAATLPIMEGSTPMPQAAALRTPAPLPAMADDAPRADQPEVAVADIAPPREDLAEDRSPALAKSGAGKPHTPLPAGLVDSYGTGSIVGHVLWVGIRPDPKPRLQIEESDTSGCASVSDEDRSLLISPAGGVANVVMTIRATDSPVPSKPIVLEFRGCRLEPHVVAVPIGATLRFANSDETNHNVHTFAKRNQALNRYLAPRKHRDLKIKKPEEFTVVCDIHRWEEAFVVATKASHITVSGADGSFLLDGLPPGPYKIQWWHEELGEGYTDTIEVYAGEATEYLHRVKFAGTE